eukprot:5924182-Prorocentrum_lima.AAC.1
MIGEKATAEERQNVPIHTSICMFEFRLVLACHFLVGVVSNPDFVAGARGVLPPRPDGNATMCH